MSFRLSRPARVTATLAVAKPGVRRGSECVVPPRARRPSDRACTRFVVKPGRRVMTFNSGARRFTLTPVFASTEAGARVATASQLVALDANANRIGPVTPGVSRRSLSSRTQIVRMGGRRRANFVDGRAGFG